MTDPPHNKTQEVSEFISFVCLYVAGSLTAFPVCVFICAKSKLLTLSKTFSVLSHFSFTKPSSPLFFSSLFCCVVGLFISGLATPTAWLDEFIIST